MKDGRAITSKENGKLGGRPTSFKPEFTDEIIKFFSIEPYKNLITKWNKEYFADGRLKKESEEGVLKPNKLPTLYRFARKIGVDYSTMCRWVEKGEIQDDDGRWNKDITPQFVRFRDSYKEAKELQKEFLINIGLAGAAPAPFAIFTAKNITDMRDKTESDVTHHLPKPILDDVFSNKRNEENRTSK